jgi:hypothetical protein
MTWLKFGASALAFSFAISAAAAFEIVDTNNGFAGPAFTQILAEQENGGSWTMNADDFSDAHIYLRSGNEKEFDGYSYSGFVFTDDLQAPPDLVSIDPASVETTTNTSTVDARH